VQFDLRFYIVALVYLIFDVEVALFYPGRWLRERSKTGPSAFGLRRSQFGPTMLFFSACCWLLCNTCAIWISRLVRSAAPQH